MNKKEDQEYENSWERLNGRPTINLILIAFAALAI